MGNICGAGGNPQRITKDLRRLGLNTSLPPFKKFKPIHDLLAVSMPARRTSNSATQISNNNCWLVIMIFIKTIIIFTFCPFFLFLFFACNIQACCKALTNHQEFPQRPAKWPQFWPSEAQDMENWPDKSEIQGGSLEC